MRHLLTTIVTLILLQVSVAEPADQTLNIDLESSSISFTLGATGHTVHGTMHLGEGVIQFDIEAGTASGRVVFDATLTETGKEKRDKKMHQKVLESEQFPEIVFTPEAITGALPEGDGESTIELSGTLSIRGSDHAVVLEAQVERTDNQISSTSSLTVPYVAWGMKDPSVFVLRTDKEVEVTIEIQGILEG